jgi:hypothetical protein
MFGEGEERIHDPFEEETVSCNKLIILTLPV